MKKNSNGRRGQVYFNLITIFLLMVISNQVKPISSKDFIYLFLKYLIFYLFNSIQSL